MTPPRSPDPAPSGGGALGAEEAYDEIVAELAELQGIVNVAEGRIVALTAQAIELGVSGGTSMTPARWLEWQAGMAPGRAADVVRLARRRHELPATTAALEAGSLSLDQAAQVARFVSSRYEASAAQVAQTGTVRQLRKALRWYGEAEPDPQDDHEPPAPRPEDEARGSISTGYDEQGYYAHIRLPEAKGAVLDQALKAMHEDLKRQARANAPEGAEPEPVYAADALVALAETALRAGEAVRPGTDRYLVHVHLEAGADGIELMTHLGVPLPDGQRRQILCDARLRALVHEGIAPVGSGRTTRTINRRLRRAIEHRDGGCAVPGCGRTTGLEIHHIVHWEDEGPTETWNLVALCAHHHTCHHQGTLGITGNADLPRHVAPGLVFTDAWGRPLAEGGPPSRSVPPTPAEAGIADPRYVHPTYEPLDPMWFHLVEDPADPADPPEAADPAPDPAPPTPPPSPLPEAQGHTASDPTRAGPDAA